MRLLTVTLYKLKMLLGDRLFFAAMILMPLLITIVSGYAFKNEKLGMIPLAFVDDDNSDYSGRILERMNEKEGLRILSVSHGEAADDLENGRVEQVFIIKQGFEQKILHGDSQGLVDVISSPSSSSAGFTSEVVAGEVTRLITGAAAADWVEKQYKKLGVKYKGNLRKDVGDFIEALWVPRPLMTIDYRVMNRDGEGAAGIGNNKAAGGMRQPDPETGKNRGMPAVPEKWNETGKAENKNFPAGREVSTGALGLISVFVMFYMLFGCGWLVEERVNGTILRLASVPGALRLSFGGNALALLAAGLLQVGVFALIDRFLFDVLLFTNVWGFIAFLLYILAVISFSLFLSSVFKTQAQLQAAAPLLALLTSFAGGCFWGYIEVPERLRFISLFTPQGLVLSAVKSLEEAGRFSLSAFLPMAVLGVISAVLLPLAYFLISQRLITKINN